MALLLLFFVLIFILSLLIVITSLQSTEIGKSGNKSAFRRPSLSLSLSLSRSHRLADASGVWNAHAGNHTHKNGAFAQRRPMIYYSLQFEMRKLHSLIWFGIIKIEFQSMEMVNNFICCFFKLTLPFHWTCEKYNLGSEEKKNENNKKKKTKHSNKHFNKEKMIDKRRSRSFATRLVFWKSLIIKWRMTMTTWFAYALSFSLSFGRLLRVKMRATQHFHEWKPCGPRSFRRFHARPIDRWHSG